MGNTYGNGARVEDSRRVPRLERLKSLRPIVLDNSLRETSVAQVRGHTIEDKDAILEAIMRTGMEDVLVGAFGDIGNVDEEWLMILKQRNEILPTFTVFSNLFDLDVEGNLFFTKTPAGIDAAIKYGIRNIVIEVDLAWSDFQIKFPLQFLKFLNLCQYTRIHVEIQTYLMPVFYE